MEKVVEATVSITGKEIKEAIAFWLQHTEQETIVGDIDFDISVDNDYSTTLEGAKFKVRT